MIVRVVSTIVRVTLYDVPSEHEEVALLQAEDCWHKDDAPVESWIDDEVIDSVKVIKEKQV